MSGGAGKLVRRAGGRGGGGRGGGRGGKRFSSSFHVPSNNRPKPSSNIHAPPDNLFAGRNPAGPNSVASDVAVDETFSLMPAKNKLAFSMIIKLAPGLIEEIRRVEAQCGAAKIKFDSVGNNPCGNIIDVGGKEFKFTWSKEVGDLCDTYEECRSGEDGNGLLVETGCAWRKVNVQRILDESTKNHVKMRSEEAERKLKSRKAIVLEHGNPSMQSQIKQLAAVEGNPWKTFKQKKEPPFKKWKAEQPHVGGITKCTSKSGLAAATCTVDKWSTSPLQSPPERSGPSMGNGSAVAKKVIAGDNDFPQMKSKVNPESLEKEAMARSSNAAREMSDHRAKNEDKQVDLQRMVINLLAENPKGMSLKGLEKAIGNMIPASTQKMDPILKKIANFQAPGRYYLKPGVGLDSLGKASSKIASSPSKAHRQTNSPKGNNVPLPAPESTRSNSTVEEESTALKEADTKQQIPDLFGEKTSDVSEGQEGSSGDSGSDTDSETDSSGSRSDGGRHDRNRSRSRSRSCEESGSGSSSDSDSDLSSSSKEGPDEDVDIISDDEHDPARELAAGTDTMRHSDGPTEEADVTEVVEMAAIDAKAPAEERKTTAEAKERLDFIGTLFDDGDRSDNSDRISEAKSKRVSAPTLFDDGTVHVKRMKAEAFEPAPISDRRKNDEELNESQPSIQLTSRVDDGEGDDVLFSQKDHLRHIPGKHVSSCIDERPAVSQEKSSGNAQHERNPVREKKMPRTTKDYSGAEMEKSQPSDATELQRDPIADNHENYQSSDLSMGRSQILLPRVSNESQKKSENGGEVMLRSLHMDVQSKPQQLDGKNDHLLSGASNNSQKHASLDADVSFYMKYKKDSLEPREPINNFSQYKEYLDEFTEKYDSYCSLNKILQSYRNEFQKLATDLDITKGRDMNMYHAILLKLKESYRQCGSRHLVLKEIFIVLHKELKNLKQQIIDFANAYRRN